ncbi:MAG: hypothetical protein GY772_20635 [bacterium]|jgi:hypothetical protein|nr:hypothetical protein [Marinobacter sp.]MBV47330.1 hypothetical protein [Roseobacter sp.]MCP4242967.1 hypothetical protein [bacterium]|tara:strand:+ start:40 stop:393 length:354 start_codon:yes stop_codon:yes gene_type:complete
MREVDFTVVAQPRLSPAMLDKIADTFQRKQGRSATAEDAQAWWDWIWPEFETYWSAKRYRNIARAILSWAARCREHELEQALVVCEVAKNIALERKQESLNAEDNVTQIDYFAKVAK